jgi:hypothetical protein
MNRIPAKYYIQRPIHTGLRENLVVKIGGGCWFWSKKRQMWVADDRIFKDCFLSGICDEITYEQAVKMIGVEEFVSHDYNETESNSSEELWNRWSG